MKTNPIVVTILICLTTIIIFVGWVFTKKTSDASERITSMERVLTLPQQETSEERINNSRLAAVSAISSNQMEMRKQQMISYELQRSNYLVAKSELINEWSTLLNTNRFKTQNEYVIGYEKLKASIQSKYSVTDVEPSPPLSISMIDVPIYTQSDQRVNVRRSSQVPPSPSIPHRNAQHISFSTERLRSDFTIMCQFSANNYDNAWPSLFWAENDALNIGIVGKSSGGGGVGTIFAHCTSGPRQFIWNMSSTHRIFPNQTYTLSLTKTANIIRLYLNGELIGESTVIKPNFRSTSWLQVGKGQHEDSYFDGTISNVKVYPYAINN